MRLTKLQKILVGILCAMVVVTLSMDFALYRALQVNPFTYKVTYKTLKSDKIPDSMSRVSAVYISDLEYGEFDSETEVLESVFDKIDELNPDILLLGGDLFSWNITPDDQQIQKMTSWINDIEAPLGKFAVFGEQDVFSSERMALVRQVYNNSQVELIENNSLFIGNMSRSGIRLVGINPVHPDVNSAFASCSADQYNVLLSHYPDNLLLENLAILPVDMAFAGNAHGTQITWPILGGYRQWEGSLYLNRDSRKSLSFDYYLTSGVGCINVQARLNSPVEIVYLLFA